MILDGILRRAAIVAIARSLRIPRQYHGELASEVNKWLEGTVQKGRLAKEVEGLMDGFKSYLGSMIKGLSGVVLTYVVAQVPIISDLLSQSGSKTGAVLAAVLAIAGSTLKDIGSAHKQEKQTRAIEDNTVAVEIAAAKPQPVVVVAPKVN